MRLECRPQLLGRCKFAVPDRLERRIELVSGTVHDFPKQFFLARDVRVQTSTLHAQGFGKVAHAGGMVAQLREELARSAVNLFFPGDGLGHVEISLSDAREVLEVNPKHRLVYACSSLGLMSTIKRVGIFQPAKARHFEASVKECFQSIGLLP
jgi:hypothetical protein